MRITALCFVLQLFGTKSIAVKSGPAKGRGGLDTVVLRHASGASAEIYLFGATLCSYKTPDGREHIYVSPGSMWDAKKAIRGGVPIAFPQFARPDKKMPQHGFARTSMWSLKEIQDSDDESVAVLTLVDTDETREQWPHAFALDFVVSLTEASLTMTLRITNTGESPFSFNALLHTYFQIPDVGEILVRGLSGRDYIDKVAGGEVKHESAQDLLIPSFIDSVYIGTEPEIKHVSVASKSGGDTLFEITNMALVSNELKPCDVVIWNPYEVACPDDVPLPTWKNFICVEPGLVTSPGSHELAGGTHSLSPNAIAGVSQKITPNSSKSLKGNAHEGGETTQPGDSKLQEHVQKHRSPAVSLATLLWLLLASPWPLYCGWHPQVICPRLPSKTSSAWSLGSSALLTNSAPGKRRNYRSRL